MAGKWAGDKIQHQIPESWERQGGREGEGVSEENGRESQVSKRCAQESKTLNNGQRLSRASRAPGVLLSTFCF